MAQDLGAEAPAAELRRNGVADVSVVVQQVLGEPVTYRGTSDDGRFCRLPIALVVNLGEEEVCEQ